jgi:radical SAM superfamily enzyme YgiQ (UPF0313 family)
MNTRKPRIYLADLIHDRHIYNYSVPLNIGYVTTNLNKLVGNAVETRIFKFPDDLISAMKFSPPDILALSNYDWNVNLNKALIKIARKINPELFVIMGGPNIRKKPEGIKDYLINHSTDMYVVNEGEDAFSNIIKYILGLWPCNLRKTIPSSGVTFPNVAYLESETKNLKLGKKPDSAHQKNIPFPSPWLAGLLDPFMNNSSFPLQPLIETNRNCPYQCHFCVWGDFELNKIRIFDFDTVIEELRYIFKKSENQFNLTIADANFGILKRDTEIAEEVRRLSDQYKKADRIFVAQAKNSVKRNLEISKILGKRCIPEFAVQTLTPDVLEYSGRRNLSNKAIEEYVAGVKKNGHEVMTDIMLGLPGETKTQYIESMKKVIDFGFQRASVADIRLLDGSVMAEDDYIKKFGLKFRYRVIPSAYGEYGGIKVIEYEKCIRKTNSMSTKDLLELRLFNANFFLLYYIELGRPMLDFVYKNNLHPIGIIAEVSKKIDENKYPLLSKYIKRFTKTANDEWYESVEDADNYFLQENNFNKIIKHGFPKLNYEYAAKLLINPDLRNEFLGLIGQAIKEKLPNQNFIINELVKFCSQRVFSINGGSNFINNKHDDMELSFQIANHLTNYIADYDYINTGSTVDKTVRKGEARDSFAPISTFSNKVENKDSSIKNRNKNLKIKIKFDVDGKKTGWLNQQIRRNGGEKDIMLAIQVVLQKNQKAFLRSWRPL